MDISIITAIILVKTSLLSDRKCNEGEKIKLINLSMLLNTLLVILLVSGLPAVGQQQFTISFVRHSQSEDIQRLMREVYSDVGILVDFVPLPVNRSLKDLKEGRVDADLLRIRSKYLDEEFVFHLALPIATAGIYLFCSKQQTCDLSDLYNAQKIIAVHQNIKNALEHSPLAIDISASVYDIKKYKKIFSLLDKQRVDGLIVSYRNEQVPTHHKNNYRIIKIATTPVYHYVHNKHRQLKARLDAALTQRLANFKKQ